MTEILPKPKTARVLQISRTETIIYDMPWNTYMWVKDILDHWHWFHSRRDKPTVTKALKLFSDCAEVLGHDVMEGVIVKREPTKQEVKGLDAGVWYDEYAFSKEDET